MARSTEVPKIISVALATLSAFRACRWVWSRAWARDALKRLPRALVELVARAGLPVSTARALFRAGYSTGFLARCSSFELREMGEAIGIDAGEAVAIGREAAVQAQIAAKTAYTTSRFRTPRYVGRGSAFKRVRVGVGGQLVFGIARDPSTLGPARAVTTVRTDDGRRVIVSRAALVAGIRRCAALNARTWRRVGVWADVAAGRSDPVTPPGQYPVFCAEHVVSGRIASLLRREVGALWRNRQWEFYHGDPVERARTRGARSTDASATVRERAAWSPPRQGTPMGVEPDSAMGEVRAMYCARRWDASSLPFQNPCDPGDAHRAAREWVPTEEPDVRTDVAGPHTRMPPVQQCVCDLMVRGNPAVADAFRRAGLEGCAYGVVTVMRYRGPPARVGRSLAWHYDKTLGVETACFSLPDGPTDLGKIVGLGGNAPVDGACGANASMSWRQLRLGPGSYWGCNAHSVYHGVGCQGSAATTLVFRTLVSRDAYTGERRAGRQKPLIPNRARDMTEELAGVRVRYLPVFDSRDCDALQEDLCKWESEASRARHNGVMSNE